MFEKREPTEQAKPPEQSALNALYDLGEKQDVEKQQAAVKYNSNERPPVKEVTEQVKREPAGSGTRSQHRRLRARFRTSGRILMSAVSSVGMCRAVLEPARRDAWRSN